MVYSFDVFDTCLTRRYAVPTDLFIEVGHRLVQTGVVPKDKVDAEAFAAARIEAERRVRERAVSEEVTLEEIWIELVAMVGINLTVRHLDVELAAETENLVQVESLKCEIVAARQTGARVIFTSDTYFSRQFVEIALRRHGFAKDGDGIYVSSEIGKTKRTGNLFFHIIQSENIRPSQLLHTGDHELSDLKVPRTLGIRCRASTQTRLTSWEKGILAVEGPSRIAISRLIGAMRASRLSRQEEAGQAGIAALVSNFLGPVLLSFVSWVLSEARRQGVRRLYFVSRDCQLACAVGQVLANDFDSIECRYLYASRQALLLPSVRSISPTGMPWLRRNFEKPFLQQLLGKLGLVFDNVRGHWESIPEAAKDTYLLRDDADWKRFWNSLNAEPTRTQLFKEIELRRKSAIAYLSAEGLFSSVPWALVDLGWHLTGQRAIKEIIQLHGGPDVCRGYYLGLKRTRCGFAEAGSAQALFHQPGFNSSAEVEDPAVFNAATLLEHVLGLADHACVSHYVTEGSKSRPIFQKPEPSLQHCEFAARIRDSVMTFARENCNLASQLSDDFTARAVIAKSIEQFLRGPSREMAATVAHIGASTDQNNFRERPLVAPLTLGQTLNLCLPHKVVKSFGLTAPELFWRGGAIALTKGGFRRLLNVRRLAGHIVSRTDPPENRAQ